MSAKRESYYAAIAAVFFLAGLSATDNWIMPAFNDWRYSDSPYAPIENIQMARNGRELRLTGDFTKIAKCDPTGLASSYWIWRWGDQGIATDVVMINGRPLVSRNVLQVGETRTVGVLEATIPEDASQDRLTLSVAAVCDRGDGKARSYELEPTLTIPAE